VTTELPGVFEGGQIRRTPSDTGKSQEICIVRGPSIATSLHLVASRWCSRCGRGAASLVPIDFPPVDLKRSGSPAEPDVRHSRDPAFLLSPQSHRVSRGSYEFRVLLDRFHPFTSAGTRSFGDEPGPQGVAEGCGITRGTKWRKRMGNLAFILGPAVLLEALVESRCDAVVPPRNEKVGSRIAWLAMQGLLRTV
jgi:hypothetical protein